MLDMFAKKVRNEELWNKVGEKVYNELMAAQRAFVSEERYNPEELVDPATYIVNAEQGQFGEWDIRVNERVGGNRVDRFVVLADPINDGRVYSEEGEMVFDPKTGNVGSAEFPTFPYDEEEVTPGGKPFKVLEISEGSGNLPCWHLFDSREHAIAHLRIPSESLEEDGGFLEWTDDTSNSTYVVVDGDLDTLDHRKVTE